MVVAGVVVVVGMKRTMIEIEKLASSDAVGAEIPSRAAAGKNPAAAVVVVADHCRRPS